MLALAYMASATGFLLQHFTLPVVGFELSRLASNISFTLAAFCLAGAIVARYGRRIPYAAFGILGGGGLAAFSWFMFIDPNLTWRIFATNFAFGGISLVVAAELHAIAEKGPGRADPGRALPVVGRELLRTADRRGGDPWTLS